MRSCIASCMRTTRVGRDRIHSNKAIVHRIAITPQSSDKGAHKRHRSLLRASLTILYHQLTLLQRRIETQQ